MTIVYSDDTEVVDVCLDIEPELYIYLQKLANEQSISIDAILNNMIREHAINSLKTIQFVPYTVYPDTQTTQPYYNDYNNITRTSDLND